MGGKRKKTVGEISRDLSLKNEKITHSPTEQMTEQLGGYEENIELCIKNHINRFPGDFYVIVITKKERLMENVIRNYFYGRISCPTPDYDQVVYKYHIKGIHLEFLWVVPDKKTCLYLKKNAYKVDPSQMELLSYVLKFADGSLFKLAKRLNGEKELTPELKDK